MIFPVSILCTLHIQETLLFIKTDILSGDALLCSHIAAFGTLYELKVAFADHIMHIPLGYHLTLGSGKLRKIMDENIESVEKFIAHQRPEIFPRTGSGISAL